MLDDLVFVRKREPVKLALMSIHELIKQRRAAMGWSMERLAEEVSKAEGLTKPLAWQTVQQWENGGSAPKRKRLEIVGRLLGVNLMGELGEPRRLDIDPSKFRIAWVIGKGSGGQLPERIWTDGDHPVGVTSEYAEVASPDPQAFLVEVVGTSMVPRYNPGEYALVEPNTDPDIEDDVLVRLANGQTLLKRLLSRRAGIRLGSYNDSEVLYYRPEEVTWLYYVAHPVPARKIKTRV